MDLVFEWDPNKDRANQGKHRIGFLDAVSVFSDPLAQIFADEDHSTGERREIIVGHSGAKRLLLVCYAESTEGRVRIISARPATRREQHDYENHATA